MERLGEEIKDYAEKDVEEYTQVYRLLTKDGDVCWVEDQTSVERDAAGNKTYNQGILVDITRAQAGRRKAAQK